MSKGYGSPPPSADPCGANLDGISDLVGGIAARASGYCGGVGYVNSSHLLIFFIGL